MKQKVFNPIIKISKLGENRIRVHFSYNPEYVQKIKTIKGYGWHPEGKCCSFPDTNGTLKKILPELTKASSK
ncbi:MAG: hypothetical protein WHV67_06585 [Thermoanaerobaculia bacterium]